MSERLQHLAVDLPVLADDLHLLIDLKERDSMAGWKLALNQARQIAEIVLLGLCREHGVSYGDRNATIECMIGPLQKHGVLSGEAFRHLRAIQNYASPASRGGVEIGRTDLEAGCAALAGFLSWYAGTLDGRAAAPAGAPKLRKATVDALRSARSQLEQQRVHALAGGTPLHGGAYTVIRPLAQGGFGITYECVDNRLKRAVAVKEFFPVGCARSDLRVVPSGGWTTATFRAACGRFLQEGEALARFDHPGIVRVLAAFEENETAYGVMEYLRGRTLDALLAGRGAPLDEAAVVAYLERVASALAVVHAAGMLHRDLKPANVMETEDGRVVLLDFGAAREFTHGMSHSRSVTITPGYAPPEQYLRRTPLGPAADIYALAATGYHLLAGRPPPSATDRGLGAALPPLHSLGLGISPGLASVLERCLAMNPEERAQSVPEFLEMLRRGGDARGVSRTLKSSGAGADLARAPSSAAPAPAVPTPLASGPDAPVASLMRPPGSLPASQPSPPAKLPRGLPGSGRVGLPGLQKDGLSVVRRWRSPLLVLCAGLIMALLGWRALRYESGWSGRAPGKAEATPTASPPVASTAGPTASTASSDSATAQTPSGMLFLQEHDEVPGNLLHAPVQTPSGMLFLGTNAQGHGEFENEKDGSVGIVVPAGSFQMGDSDMSDNPRREVTLPAYGIGKYPVTNAQYRSFVNATGHQTAGPWQQFASRWGDRAPVVVVSWNDAVAYCQWAGLRLPTEEEWEKAARGTDGRKYPWGNEWDASRCRNSVGPTSSGAAPVGSYPAGASPYGCLDMAGNVWQWTASQYNSSYDLRVLRGGSWDDLNSFDFRAASRNNGAPGSHLNLYGLRAARTL